MTALFFWQLHIFLSHHREDITIPSTTTCIKLIFILTLNSRVWLIVAGCGSRVAGPKVAVAVASPMSRSRVQCRGRGSKVAAGENDLGFEVTAEWKRLIRTQYKGKKSFLLTILYGSQLTGYGCKSQQNNVSRKDLKEKAGRLLCSPQVHFVFFLSGPVA